MWVWTSVETKKNQISNALMLPTPSYYELSLLLIGVWLYFSWRKRLVHERPDYQTTYGGDTIHTTDTWCQSHYQQPERYEMVPEQMHHARFDGCAITSNTGTNSHETSQDSSTSETHSKAMADFTGSAAHYIFIYAWAKRIIQHGIVWSIPLLLGQTEIHAPLPSLWRSEQCPMWVHALVWALQISQILLGRVRLVGLGCTQKVLRKKRQRWRHACLDV